MPTLAETADETLRAAEKLEAEGNHEGAAALAIVAAKLWKAVAGVNRVDVLTGGKYSPTLKAAMDVEQREAISDGRAGRQARSLIKAARAVGIRTMGELAQKLAVNPGFLSQAVSGKKKMPAALAEKIRDLTGWEP